MEPPTLAEIEQLAGELASYVVRTPTIPYPGLELDDLGPKGARVHLKLELFQRTGSFKPRGAVANVLAMSDDARRRGVVAVSAGNHALAVAYAAKVLGTHAKVVMPVTASPARVVRCRRLGAEVILEADVHVAFARAEAIAEDEGRTFVHPFESSHVVAGTGTLGVEIVEDVPDLDAVVVPIGGGGLAAGVALAVSTLRPGTRIYGVEPYGADTMFRSLEAGRPVAIDRVTTIADSLGAPHAAPLTFGICRDRLEKVVRVDDDDLCGALALLARDAKLAVEPAGAAATAALVGPLRDELAGARVVVVCCGANLDAASFGRFLARGTAVLPPPEAAEAADRQ